MSACNQPCVGNNKPPLLFLAAVAFLNFLLVGYRFAVDDQLLYLALVPRYFDASLIHPQDVYLQFFVARTQTTLFLILAPLLKWVNWEWPAFILYLITKFFVFWGVWSLAHGLTRDRMAAALAVLFLLLSFMMYELTVQFYVYTLICRYAVIPLLFFGLRRLWDGRYLAAVFLFGAAFQIHALSMMYWLVIVGSYLLWNIRDILWCKAPDGKREFNKSEAGKLLRALGVFLLFALPMMVWRAWTPMPEAPASFTNQDWFDYSYVWKGKYIFYSLWNAQHFWSFVFCLGCLLLSIFQVRRDQAMRFFAPTALGALAAMAVHFVATELLPCQAVYQLQWYRASDVLPLLASIGVARLVSAEAKKPWPWAPALVAASFLAAVVSEESKWLFSIMAVALLMVMSLEKKHRLLSGLALVFAAIPTLIVIQFQGNWLAAPVNLWIMPVWWAVAAMLFVVVFYARTWLDTNGANEGWLKQQTARLTGGAGLFMLALTVFYAPEWQDRGWYRFSKPSARLKECWDRMSFPGRALNNDWVGLQHWARTNTPPQAMFFVPPGLNGFRVFSERSVFVEYFDGEVGIFSSLLAYEWQKRIRLFGFDPTQDKMLGHARGAYYRITPEKWRELAKEYEADYLITMRRVKLPFELLHQQGRYAVWQITEAPNAEANDVVLKK